MEKYFPTLQACPLFDGIGWADLLRMLSCLGARVIRFEKKDTVLAEGNAARYIGIVLTGSVQIIQIDYYGNRSIVLQAGPSAIFGEAFACAEVQALPVTVVADEPSDIMLIDCGHILHTCENNCGFHQQLIFNLMKDLATKSILYHQKMEIASKRSTREKLMAYLMAQAKLANSSSFEIPFDRQELADYLAVDRSGLSVQIGKLCREGLIACERNRFTLL